MAWCTSDNCWRCEGANISLGLIVLNTCTWNMLTVGPHYGPGVGNNRTSNLDGHLNLTPGRPFHMLPRKLAPHGRASWATCFLKLSLQETITLRHGGRLTDIHAPRRSCSGRSEWMAKKARMGSSASAADVGRTHVPLGCKKRQDGLARTTLTPLWFGLPPSTLVALNL